MHPRSLAPILAAALALAAPPATAGVLTQKPCIRGVEPAATLLVPYFEVDLDGAFTTLFSVNNGRSTPTLAHVVLWTDWGIPVLAFDIYLTGWDVQTINLRDVLNGVLPATGSATSNRGDFSGPNDNFPDCDAGDVGGGPFDPAPIRLALTGRGISGSCFSSPRSDTTRATGYVTIDVANRCSSAAPGDPGYFQSGGLGVAGDANVLWGDYFFVDPGQDFAQGEPAVHIVADPDFFAGGDYTFYGRYVAFDGSDDRAPLSSFYAVRYLQGGPFSGGTELVVWRDTRSPAATPVPCGTEPSWGPLGELEMVLFDEEENGIFLGNLGATSAFPWASQRAVVGAGDLVVPFPFGWLRADLWHADGTRAQAWVSSVLSAEGRYSVGYSAGRLDDMCSFAP